jgi:CHAD domain-containing protein
MLTSEERDLLERFVKQNTPDAPYWARVQIVLQTADKTAQEDIAVQVGVPITQVRLWQRAFNKQRLAVFPETLFLPPPLFTPDDPVAEAGRCLLQEMQAKIDEHWAAAAASADHTAVHEIRKAIRQIFTIYRLFAPYFVQGSLLSYRRQWRRVMRRLGRSRDTAIFLASLAEQIAQVELGEDERADLMRLQEEWASKFAAANKDLIHYLNRRKVTNLRAEYRRFLQDPGSSLFPPKAPASPVRLVAPLMITQKLTVVRQDEPLVASGTMAELHQLRIHFKELRYTIRFFAPLLGLPVVSCLNVLEEIQNHLGGLNDVRTGLELLSENEPSDRASSWYLTQLQARADELRATFAPLWHKFNSREWRQNLGLALARL